MLTKITVRNFKQFSEAQIDLSQDLGAPVVFVGPNNSGKTSALQAVALWRMAVTRLLEKKAKGSSAKERPGATINRLDVAHFPVPAASLLWRGIQLNKKAKSGGAPSVPVRIEIVVEGLSKGKPWTCGVEFQYINEESFSCRPLRSPDQDERKVKDCAFSEIPQEAGAVSVALLQPMSGLASTEPRWEPGRVDVLLGEGQTALVIRNLCAQIYEKRGSDGGRAWNDLAERVLRGFGVTINPPEHVSARGEITMSFRDERHRCTLDLSSSGRGLQQTLLLLAYMHSRPGTVLLLDEPDAHLEVLRQRQAYELICEVSESTKSQVIAASHSEVLLSEAANKGGVIAFVGSPHRINGQTSNVLKALTSVGFADYYEAERAGWVLYLEGPTDHAILLRFARRLGYNEAVTAIESALVHCLGNNRPDEAHEHFHALREAKSDLLGVAIYDRLDRSIGGHPQLREFMWKRREIENYIASEALLIRVAEGVEPEDLFGEHDRNRRIDAMREAIREVSHASETFGLPPIWSHDAKASDEVLEPIFREYAKRQGVPMGYRKRDFHKLVEIMSPAEIDVEVREKLDEIVRVAQQAQARLKQS